MPTFDFECEKCQAQFQEQLPFGSKELPVCPECGLASVRKILRPPMVHFKGSGFYKTDSRSTPSKPAAPKAAEAKPAETKPAEAKKDTSPPASPTPKQGAEKKKS